MVMSRFNLDLESLKSEYQSAILVFQNAVDNNTDLPGSAIARMKELQLIRNDYTRLNDLKGFEVISASDGFRIVDGFGSFNRLLVDVLNDNLALVLSIYKAEVQDEFNREKASLKKEAEDLIIEIDK